MNKTSPFLQEVVEEMLDNGASDIEVQEVVETANGEGNEVLVDACNARDGYEWNTETKTCELIVEDVEAVDIKTNGEEFDPTKIDIGLDQPEQVLLKDFSDQVVVNFKGWDFNFDGVDYLENDHFLNGLDTLHKDPPKWWPEDDNGNKLPLTLDDVKVYHNYLSIAKNYDTKDDKKFYDIQVASIYFKDINKHAGIVLKESLAQRGFSIEKYVNVTCQDAENKKECKKNAQKHYKERIDYEQNGTLPKDMSEEVFLQAKKNRIEFLQEEFERDLNVSSEDYWMKFHHIKTTVKQIRLPDQHVPNPWLSKESQDLVIKNPALYNSIEIQDEINLNSYLYFESKLPNAKDFEKAITQAIDLDAKGPGINQWNEGKLEDLLRKSFPNQFNEARKNHFKVEQVEGAVDRVRITHPSGYYIDVDLEGKISGEDYRNKKHIEGLIKNIAKFLSGPTTPVLEGLGNFDNWSDIDYLITNPQGRDWTVVVEENHTKRRLKNLKTAYPDKAEILLLDIMGDDGEMKQLTPYTYEMGEIHSEKATEGNSSPQTYVQWYRVDENGKRTPIRTLIPVFDQSGKVTGYKRIRGANTLAKNAGSDANRKLNAFLTYRYYHANRSENGIHAWMQNPNLGSEFDHTAKENDIFMNSDGQESIDILSEIYGELGFTFSFKHKFGMSPSGRHNLSASLGDCAGATITVTHKASGEQKEIATGLNCLLMGVESSKMFAGKSSVTDIETISAIIGKSRSDLTSFIDSKSNKNGLDGPELREQIWRDTFGPNGALNPTEKQELALTKELSDIEAQVKSDIGIEEYSKVTALRQPHLAADKGSKYASEINIAISSLQASGFKDVSKEQIAEFVLRIIKANKLEAIREINFNTWYNSTEGKQDIKFWKSSNKSKQAIQLQIEAATREMSGGLQKEVLDLQEKLTLELSTLSETPGARYNEVHEANLADPDHQYELTDFEILTGAYYRLEQGPFAGKIVPYSVATQYLENQVIMNTQFEKLKTQQEEIDKKVFELDDVDSVLGLLEKSYNWSDWATGTLKSGLATTYNGWVGTMNDLSPEVQEMITKNAIAIEGWKTEYSQSGKVKWNEIGDEQGFVKGFATFLMSGMGIGAEQAGNLLLMMASGGGVAGAASKTIHFIMAGSYVGISSGANYYYQNAADYYSTHDTLEGFDPDGTFRMESIAVGIANGASAMLMTRFMGNVGSAIKKFPGLRNVTKAKLKESIMASMNLQTGVIGSGAVDQFGEVATEIVEGIITGEHLTQAQLMDVWMETGI